MPFLIRGSPVSTAVRRPSIDSIASRPLLHPHVPSLLGTTAMAKRKRSSGNGDTAAHDVLSREIPTGSPSESQAAYYLRMEEDFDPTTLTQRIYAKESESLQDWIKRLWNECARELLFKAVFIKGDASRSIVGTVGSGRKIPLRLSSSSLSKCSIISSAGSYKTGATLSARRARCRHIGTPFA